MGYTNKQLTEKWHAERDRADREEARANELEAKLKEAEQRNKELDELARFYEAANKSSNEDANAQREKVAKLEARLSPEARAFLERAEREPKVDAISTDTVIRAAASVISSSEHDTSFLNIVMAAVQSEPERSYIELPVEENNSKDTGAPYGRSDSGEYLDPDEEEEE